MSSDRSNLSSCPDCGHQVSRRATACPNCGCPFALTTPKRAAERPAKRGSGGAGCVLFLLLVIGGGIFLATEPGQQFFNKNLAPMITNLMQGRNPLGPGIVGKWKLDSNSSNTIEFFPDGTLREVALFNSSNGKYTVISTGRMKTETDGLLWGSNVATWTYSISGDRLTMTLEGANLTLTWTRIH